VWYHTVRLALLPGPPPENLGILSLTINPQLMLTQSPATLLQMIAGLGLVGKSILLLLAAFSIVSWAVLWDRFRAFSLADRETDAFLGAFRSAPNLGQAREKAEAYRRTPLAALLRAGYHELSLTSPRRGETQGESEKALGMRNLDRGLERAMREETARLERGLGLLATTASVTPFIGLLGTVWGIMEAFQAIGLQGSANLATVAPGIAEALVNTAAGLFAAIPAVLGYNHFLARMRRIGSRMDNFASELLARADRILHPPSPA
jgi:biopolymer transport protein TolQ